MTRFCLYSLSITGLLLDDPFVFDMPYLNVKWLYTHVHVYNYDNEGLGDGGLVHTLPSYSRSLSRVFAQKQSFVL